MPVSRSSSPGTCGCSSAVHWAIAIVLLSLAIGPGYALPRPSRNTQLLFSELLGVGNEDSSSGNNINNYYGEQLRQQQQQQRLPSFGRKWPSLRDLLLTADYDDFGVSQESEERGVDTNSRLLARLHKLSDNGAGDELRYNVVNELTNVPSKKVMMPGGHSLKEHNTKKNVQYMSPCHFKICNMGRKRNAGSNNPY
ncbi:uncharacterized protein LOC110177617 isoform X2 [Drosophila serrata]|uniref:uncharacterized protein LOC110177617 isoform X2 n=1 Tax=Drosophila serrata TaxID=7274 RepID=UPI000A1D36B8|nr:uncharacterized protein LOC110177617 isoform X2 [Drosophila serrata]